MCGIGEPETSNSRNRDCSAKVNGSLDDPSFVEVPMEDAPADASRLAACFPGGRAGA